MSGHVLVAHVVSPGPGNLPSPSQALEQEPQGAFDIFPLQIQPMWAENISCHLARGAEANSIKAAGIGTFDTTLAIT